MREKDWLVNVLTEASKRGKRLCFMATSTLALQIEANHLSGTAITWLCAVVSTARSALLFPMSHATSALVRMAHGPL